MDSVHVIVLIAYCLVVGALFSAAMRMDEAEFRMFDLGLLAQLYEIDPEREPPSRKLHAFAISFWLGVIVFLWFIGFPVLQLLLMLVVAAAPAVLYFRLRVEDRAAWLKRIPYPIRVVGLMLFCVSFYIGFIYMMARYFSGSAL